MIKITTIETFLDEYKSKVLIDVRSPIEYKKGHIPGSHNVPIFTDDERAQIGTAYKKISVEKAIELGESFAIPKIHYYVEEIGNLSPSKEVYLYCFRGGMRSQRFSQMLEEHGFSVIRLEKGYKSYRQEVLKSFSAEYSLKVLGGKTGSGKTEILEELDKKNETIINLEAMSNHRGSAFGTIGMGAQPTTEQFENHLFEQLREIGTHKQIWVEDESLNIGRVFIPSDFYTQMKKSPLIVLEINKESRVERLCRDYGNNGQEPLIEGIKKIQKRLGGERTQKALDALENDDFSTTASIILEYYDKCYSYGLTKKTNSKIDILKIENDDPEKIAHILLSY